MKIATFFLRSSPHLIRPGAVTQPPIDKEDIMLENRRHGANVRVLFISSINRGLVTALIGMMLSTAVSAAGAAKKPSGATTDHDIVLAMQDRFAADPAITSRLIDITSDSGVVTLSGLVGDLLEHERAIEMAASILGVTSVIDRLRINPVYRIDRDIRKDVMAALAADPISSLYHIDVAVKDAMATLTGAVPSLEEREFVGLVAGRVKGLRKVDNRVEVKLVREPSGAGAADEIMEVMRWDPYLDAGLISVSVKSGVATLKGTVGSLSEKAFAHDDAILPGVTAIDDSQLTVEPWDRQHMRKPAGIIIRTDDGIAKSVRHVLANDTRIARFPVEITVVNGVVTVTGKVGTLRDLRFVREDAENVSGVGRVVTKIKVRPEKEAGDSALVTRAKEAMERDPVMERKAITPISRNGVLSLYGNVNSYFERRYCSDLLSAIPGVVDIRNMVAVIAPSMPWKNDLEIETDLIFEIRLIAQLYDDTVAVKVDNGTAILSGKVGTPSDMALVVETAFRAGAREVHVDITHDGVKEYGIYHAGDRNTGL